MKGIDVSENNGNVDWQAVADAGYEFAIVRCSYGRTNKDERFIENVNGAHAAGLKVGAFHYGYALTREAAIEEAEFCHKVIEESGVGLELPVFYDMEDADGYKAKRGFNFSAENVTAICKNFVDNIGYNTGVYASEDYLKNLIDWQSLGCAVWNASWYDGANPEPNPEDNTDGIKGMLWQYTSEAYVGGQRFDADFMYE